MTASVPHTSFPSELLPNDNNVQTDEEVSPLMRRMQVIESLIKTTSCKVNIDWIQELQSINEQLLTLKRDRMMRASLERLERGCMRLGIHRE
jgi:hypothetical protein